MPSFYGKEKFSAADKIRYGGVSGEPAEADLHAFVRNNLLNSMDASTFRTGINAQEAGFAFFDRTTTIVTLATAGDTLRLNTTEKIEFRDTGIYIHSSIDGVLDIVADVSINMTAPMSMIDGRLSLTHTSAAPDTHCLDIICDADAMGGVAAIQANYITGAIGAGDNAGVILVNVDQATATGGTLGTFGVTTTEGLADVYGIGSTVGTGPVIQLSGDFVDMDSALVNATDRLSEFTSAVSNIAMFVADDDTVTIGNATQFGQIEFILDTVASGAGIDPVFEYSTGVGTWTTFTPGDTTDGMRSSGSVIWLPSDLAGWVVGTGSEYLIRITRNRNSLGTVPIEQTVQISLITVYLWDKDGNIVNNNITTEGDITVGGIVKPSITKTTMTGNLTLDATSTQVHWLDPNGSDRVVTLPAESNGLNYIFKHIGSANTVTIEKDDTTDLIVLSTDNVAAFMCDGTDWEEM